jgi:hypothetical protein
VPSPRKLYLCSSDSALPRPGLSARFGMWFQDGGGRARSGTKHWRLARASGCEESPQSAGRRNQWVVRAHLAVGRPLSGVVPPWLRELEERTFTRERLAAIGDLSEPMRTVVASADRVAHDFQFAEWRPRVTVNVAKELVEELLPFRLSANIRPNAERLASMLAPIHRAKLGRRGPLIRHAAGRPRTTSGQRHQ